MNRPARFTQADVTRAALAAGKAGIAVGSVDILPDGTIRIIARDAAAPVDDAEAYFAKRKASQQQ